MEKEYKSVAVAGKLYAGDSVYWLIKPYPTNGDWETEHTGLFRFSVVPWLDEVYLSMSKGQHSYARDVIVSGTWHIEYLSDKEILVQKPEVEMTREEEVWVLDLEPNEPELPVWFGKLSTEKKEKTNVK